MRLAQLVRAKGVHDQRLLEAIASVPRAGFVPATYRERAYRDEPVPIGHAQVTTQPSLVAAMLEALTLRGNERVFEVGTGYGFQTALLARLARRVFSVERFADLAEAARRNLPVTGSGTRRWWSTTGPLVSPSKRSDGLSVAVDSRSGSE